MGLKGTGRYVMVEPLAVPESSQGGIYIPENVKSGTNRGVVRSIGEQVFKFPDGSPAPAEFKVGDVCYFPKLPIAKRMKYDDKEVLFLLLDEIFAAEDSQPEGKFNPVSQASD